MKTNNTHTKKLAALLGRIKRKGKADEVDKNEPVEDDTDEPAEDATK